jgi:hypothetical protein
MSAKYENTITVTPEMRDAAIAELNSPEMQALLDAMTDDDIAAQIASNPDAAPELDDAWFAKARLVTPLKAAE